MSPYRDHREALRVRSGELEQALAEKTALLAKLRSQRAAAERGWYWAAALLLGMAVFICGRAGYRREEAPPGPTGLAPLHWQARVVGGSREGLRLGMICSVDLVEPCTATIKCDSFGYRSQGSCEGCLFIDRGSTPVDGSPECQIDARSGRIFLREVGRDRDSRMQERWSAELVRQ